LYLPHKKIMRNASTVAGAAHFAQQWFKDCVSCFPFKAGFESAHLDKRIIPQAVNQDWRAKCNVISSASSIARLFAYSLIGLFA
jgi:hypothetical protein